MKQLRRAFLFPLATSICFICSSAEAETQSLCDEFRPHKRIPQTTLDRWFDPRESDVTLVINGAPVRYRDTESEQYDALKDKLQLRLQKLKDPQKVQTHQIVVFQAPLAELQSIKAVLNRLESPYLELKLDKMSAKVYYVPGSAESTVDEVAVADVLDALGFIYYKRSDFREAQEKFAESVRLKGTHFGQHSLQVAESQDILGLVYQARGDLDKAIECFLVSLDIRQNQLPADAPEIVDTAQRILDVESAARACAYKLDPKLGLGAARDAHKLLWTINTQRLASKACPKCVPTSIGPAPLFVMPHVKQIAENAVVAAEEQGDQQSAEASQLKHLISTLLKQNKTPVLARAED